MYFTSAIRVLAFKNGQEISNGIINDSVMRPKKLHIIIALVPFTAPLVPALEYLSPRRQVQKLVSRLPMKAASRSTAFRMTKI